MTVSYKNIRILQTNYNTLKKSRKSFIFRPSTGTLPFTVIIGCYLPQLCIINLFAKLKFNPFLISLNNGNSKSYIGCACFVSVKYLKVFYVNKHKKKLSAIKLIISTKPLKTIS